MLAGQIALVTGGSGEIGAAIADELAKNGARVAIQFATNQPQSSHFSIESDFLEPGFEEALLDTISAKIGVPNILINCAADQALQDFSQISPAEMSKMLQVNVSAILALSKEFARRCDPQFQNNAIVNISSIEAQNPAPGHGHYAASKAALDALTRTFASEFGPLGIRSNAVAPGLISRRDIEIDWPDGVARWRKACPLGRLGRANDVARAVLFLASPAASWINGSILNVDGGMSAMSAW